MKYNMYPANIITGMRADEAVEIMVKGSLVLLAVAAAAALLVPFVIGYALTAVVWRISAAIINFLFPIRPDPAEITRHREMLRRAKEEEEQEKLKRKNAKPLWQLEEEAKEAARLAREAAADGIGSGPAGGRAAPGQESELEEECTEVAHDRSGGELEEDEQGEKREEPQKGNHKSMENFNGNFPAVGRAQANPTSMMGKVFLERKLTERKRAELILQGYRRLRISAFGDSGASYYLVKPRWNEGLKHAFFCHLVESELWKRGKRPGLNVNNGPDMTFEHEGTRYCFEVETGTNLERHRGRMEFKFGSLRDSGFCLYILVTRKKLRARYGKYGTVITRASLRNVLNDILSKR